MYLDGMRGGSRRLQGRRRFLRSVLDACFGAASAHWCSGVALAAPASQSGLVASRDLRSLDDYIEAVTFWKQRCDLNGDGLFDERDLLEFLGRKGTQPGDEAFHFGFDLDGDDAAGNADIQLLFDLLSRFPGGFALDPFADVTSLQTIAAYYPWYTNAASWASARSTPLRGQYQSLDSTLYLQQRLEGHASGVDVFAVSTFNPEQARLFHEMQDGLEQTYGPDLTRFLWMYEILGRLPFELNNVGQEIVDFDLSSTRGAFVAHMVELAGYFHDNYLTLDGRYYPIWIWKTDTIRGDFVRAVEEARSAVASCCGKELAIIGGELAQLPTEARDLESRMPAFFGMTHYGIYTPRFTNVYGGRLSQAHSDFTMENLLTWIQMVRDQGIDTVYQRPMIYWPPTQFGFDDTKGTRNNPPLASSRDEIEYYVQQLDRRVILPHLDIITHLNHTSYNEHREGHGLEPTDGYNAGRSWLQITNVYRGPSQYYRRTIVQDPILRSQLATVFDTPELG